MTNKHLYVKMHICHDRNKCILYQNILLDRCVFSFYKEKILNDHNHGIIANTFYC